MYARLDHHNVVKLVKFGVAESRPYLALEFIEGQNLRALLAQRSPLPNDVAISLTLSLLAGLAAIHQHEIVHRDLKPENIMIGHDGAVKICDFDLAIAIPSEKLERGANANAGRSLITGHWLSGSPGYFSPEAILGESVTARSDLFALGIILYEMFTGTRPFIAATASGEMNAVVRLPHLTPSRLNPAIPPEIEPLINQLLAKAPAERPESAKTVLDRLARRWTISETEWRTRLQKYLNDPPSYRSEDIGVTAAPVVKATLRRPNMGLRLAAAIACVALIVLLAYRYLLSPTPEPANSHSTAPAEVATQEKMPLSRTDSILRVIERLSAIDSSSPRPRGFNIEDIKTPQAPVPPAVAAETKAPPRHFSRALFVRSVPWAYLFVNGDSVGQAPRTTPLLPAGQSHAFIFKKPNFPTLSYTVKVDSTTADTLVFSLWERVAQVEISINPWAEFYLNGELREASAKNPFLVLLPGEYHFKFKNPGLGERTEALFLRAGETRRLEVNMFQGTRREQRNN